MQRRRLDQVLDPEFSSQVDDLDIDTVRDRRALAREVENELSYYRRLLHGRLDLLKFEVRRRTGEETRTLIEALPEILSDPDRNTRGTGRATRTDLPLLPDVGRREIDSLLGNDVLLRIDEISAEDLAVAIATLEEVEARFSTERRQVQQVEDRFAARLTDLYRAENAVQES